MVLYDDDGNEIQDQDEKDTDPNFMKNLRQKARQTDAAEAERDAAKKELLYLKAGIDLDSPHGKLFAKGYDGDLTAEAVKAAATDYGILAPVTPDASQAEVDALGKFDGAAVGSEGITEMDAAMDALNKVPYLGADGQPNPDGPNQIIQALIDAGLTISRDQPGDMFQIPGTNPIPM